MWLNYGLRECTREGWVNLLLRYTLHVEDSFNVDTEELLIPQVDADSWHLIRVRANDPDGILVETTPMLHGPFLLQVPNQLADFVDFGHVVNGRAVRIAHIIT